MIKGLFQGPAPPQVGPPGSTTASRRRFPRGDPRNCIREGDTLNIMQVSEIFSFGMISLPCYTMKQLMIEP